MSKASKKSPTGKKTGSVKALRDKHLKDKHHVITDEDINQLDLHGEREDTGTAHTPDLPNDESRPKDEDKDPKRVTPWDVLDS